MNAIVKRPRAVADLVEIWEYIAEDSEARADAFIDEIGRKFTILAKKPAIGRLRPELIENLRSSLPPLCHFLPAAGGRYRSCPRSS